MSPRRPILRYHGGKWKLAPWIIGHFPTHRIYVEPYGGAGSVLLRKPPCYSEVYNDLDGEVVNVFRVLRDRTQSVELLRQLDLTPFAREEFKVSYEPCEDPIERARRTIIRAFMGFGSNAASGKQTGFRACSNRSGTTPAHDWKNLPDSLALIIERLQGVVIENRDALDCMKQHDSPETLHYVDPPYVHATRSINKGSYRHEMPDDAHVAMCDFLKTLKGMVVLSGYSSELYAHLGWHRVEKSTYADGARARIECLWLNPAASRQTSLLEVV